MSPTISIIAALDKKNGIGKGNKMAWRIREDLIRLAKRTKDGVVILGRNTYESMAGYYDISGKPMPAREYIVVTRQKDFKSKRDNTYMVNSIEGALKRAKESGEREVFIIGGAEIFRQTISLSDRLYLTLVDGDFDCDTFFPDYSDFKKVISEEVGSDESLTFTYKVLEKD
ncbi:MAG TPA: dihydrofolate reductase [Patescibacteria group bacterium]|nr:dihydrofolate reductase [Patescibacteria group bacterium]